MQGTTPAAPFLLEIMKQAKANNPEGIRNTLEERRYFLSCDQKREISNIDKSSIGDIGKVSTGRERFLRRQNKTARLQQAKL